MPNSLVIALAEKMLQGAIESRDRNEVHVAVGLWRQILAEPDSKRPDLKRPGEVAMYRGCASVPRDCGH